MGWELRDFQLEYTGGLASPFQFEILLAANGKPSQVLRGDGVVIREQTVRINRPDALARQVQSYGLSPENFFAALQHLVVERAINVAPSAA